MNITKNPAYVRHWISWRVQILAPTPEKKEKKHSKNLYRFCDSREKKRKLKKKNFFFFQFFFGMKRRTFLTRSYPYLSVYEIRGVDRKTPGPVTDIANYRLNRPDGPIQWKHFTGYIAAYIHCILYSVHCLPYTVHPKLYSFHWPQFWSGRVMTVSSY